MRRTAMVALLIAAAACGGRTDGEALSERGIPADLVASLDVRVVGDTVDLGLHIANAAAEPVDLEFATAQRYDFAVLSAEGVEVWRWSSDQMFAQVLGSERVEGGGALEYRATWPAAGASGRYVAEGQLVAQNRPVTLRTEFEVPAR